MADGAAWPGRGLSEAEAAARLVRDGPNELPRAGRRTLPRIILEILSEPMFALLLGAGALYLLLGDFGEALMLLAFAQISVTIAVVQESRSERVLEALRDLTSPRALVIRDGKRRRIAGREVVRGDTILLAEGDRVPADAVLRSGIDLQTDESLLTGEAIPVRKVPAPGAPPPARPGGDDLPYVYSGGLVVRGLGSAEVIATGASSEIGRIGLALGAIDMEQPPLQRQTRRLVRTVAGFGMALSVLAVLLYALLRGSWLDGLLGGIALSMSMLPEEFPLVLTVFMVMGAWRISRAGVLTRRAASIETLGAATLLCTDKTGTLTQNRMSVAELAGGAGSFRPQEHAAGPLPDAFAELAETAMLASIREPFDPMEIALHELGARLPAAHRRLSTEGHLEKSYSLRPELLAMAQIWRPPGSLAYVAAGKGAPEAIAELCRFGEAERARMRREADAMAARGMRILGVAAGEVAGPPWPESLRGLQFRFLGLIGLADPLRPGAREAVRECRAAGIKVAMITGDYAATARAIATEAGIDAEEVMTGDDIARADEAELRRRVRTTTVFARVLPEQKLRLVAAYKANGEIVAMTGDGVNDAPSLKAAHIGVAMGGRGTDVAREAASIVLLDDDFGSIVRTIRLGRRIYDNLRKAMGYILAVHVPIAGVALLPLLFGWPLVLGPVHIAFIEMVIDPVCSIVFEAEREEADVMRRPPRSPATPLFSTALVLWSLAQGTLVLALLAAIMALAQRYAMPENEVRALVFVSLVATNVGLIFVNRSFSASVAAAVGRWNPALWSVLTAVAALLAIVLYWLPARALFRFGPLHADDLGVCLGAGVAVLLLLELLKPIWRARLTA
jgi:P-type Ca2+ transporter type 2C